MTYRDGRFARHSHFRYAVFNTLMRRQSMEKTGFFVRKADTGNITVEDIQEAFDRAQGGQQFTDSVVRWSASLKGTRPFWAQQGKQLEAMVRFN
jgi:ATP-dependent DNA helicase PIF1